MYLSQVTSKKAALIETCSQLKDKVGVTAVISTGKQCLTYYCICIVHLLMACVLSLYCNAWCWSITRLVSFLEKDSIYIAPKIDLQYLEHGGLYYSRSDFFQFTFIQLFWPCGPGLDCEMFK